jgi:hypothetical protein
MKSILMSLIGIVLAAGMALAVSFHGGQALTEVSTSASCDPNAAGQWLTYHNVQMGFSIQYPPSWNVYGPLTEAQWLKMPSRVPEEYSPKSMRVEFQPADYAPVWVDVVSGLGPDSYPVLSGGSTTVSELYSALGKDPNISHMALRQLDVDHHQFLSLSLIRRDPWQSKGSYGSISYETTLYSINHDLIVYLITNEACYTSLFSHLTASVVLNKEGQ